MVFRRILSLLRAALRWPRPARSASNPPQTRRPPRRRPGIRRAAAARASSASRAGLSDAALQAYVDRVGQKLVSQAAVARQLPLRRARPAARQCPRAAGGYVFVTRGLLALLDDEAELAAALGHELGHLAQRHASQRARARQSVLDAAVEAAIVDRLDHGRPLGGARRAAGAAPLFARAGARGRPDRRRLLVQAGYRGDAMTSLIDKLRRQSQFELQLMGEQPEFGRSAQHDLDPSRAGRAAGRAARASRRPRRRARPTARPFSRRSTACRSTMRREEGFVRGQQLPPSLAEARLRRRRATSACSTTTTACWASAATARCCSSPAPRSPMPGSLADWMRNKLKPTPTDIQSTEIGGAEAAIGARPRGSDTGLGQIRYVMIRHGDQVCYLQSFERGPDRDRRIEVLVTAARTFRTCPTPRRRPAALSPARRAAGRHHRPRSSPSACPTATYKMERLLAAERRRQCRRADAPAAGEDHRALCRLRPGGGP